MTHGYEKFDTAKLERLNDPGRFEGLPPAKMWSILATEHPDAVVEIGAGTGLFAAAFAGIDPGVTIYAADIEEVMLAWMTENRPEVAAGRIVPVHADESNVPLPDGFADGVYMINLHHELVDPAASYAEALRILRPGGRVLVVDWADRDTEGGPPLRIRPSAAQIGEFLVRAGFSDVAIHVELAKHSVVSATRPGGSL